MTVQETIGVSILFYGAQEDGRLTCFSEVNMYDGEPTNLYLRSPLPFLLLSLNQPAARLSPIPFLRRKDLRWVVCRHLFTPFHQLTINSKPLDITDARRPSVSRSAYYRWKVQHYPAMRIVD